VSPLCSRNARPRKGLVGRAQWGTHPGHPWETSKSKIRRVIASCSLRPCLGQGASLGEEAVLADSGREGEVSARVGRVRKLDFLNSLRRIVQEGLVGLSAQSLAVNREVKNGFVCRAPVFDPLTGPHIG
jgi:hypothetical protein